MVILGASLSQGFGAKPGWAATVVASRTVPPETTTEHCALFFFTNPTEKGTNLAAKAREDAPTLVLAVDFLFWFGYGAVDVNGGKLASEDGRLQLLERGLAILEAFTCPLVIGDFPDASPAVGKILAPEQMPKPETLAALNERVRLWATARTNVIVLPLADWMDRVRSGKPVRVGAHELGKEAIAGWLQEDHLHPTTEGLLGLAMLLNESLINQGYLGHETAVDSPSEIRGKVAIALREQRKKQFGEMLADFHREAEKHPEGSVERLETLGKGLVTLCRIYPEEPSAAEELVRVLDQLPKDRASALAKMINLSTVPAGVREKLSDILGPEAVPDSRTAEAKQP
ncbi:MAG: hypothetical protein KIT22_04145 [Verrucomicrobiae bacterium]|nr:hypothetical protein [Verrucomicrobiae bacterium]